MQSCKELEEQVTQLTAEVAKHRRMAAIAEALVKMISGVTRTSSDLAELFALIHQALAPVIDTTNFFIAMYDAEKDRIRFPYLVDTVDKHYPPVEGVSRTASLTAEVIRTRMPLMVKKEEMLRRRRDMKLLAPNCTPSEVWLGVPLKTGEKLFGVMAVQSYDAPDCYDEIDLEVMASAGQQVGLAIDHFVAEESLQKSENRYRLLLDMAVEGILLGTEDGTITEANRYMCELVGMRREDLVGRHISTMPFTRDSIERFPLRFDLLHKGERVLSERVIIRPDGSMVHVEMRSKMMPDRSLQAMFSDISERKKTERALMESEERFRALHNGSFGGIAIHDRGVILECNQGLADMTGFTREELLGMNGLALIAEEHLELVRKHISERYTKDYEAMGVRRDGTRYPMRISGRDIPYKGKMVRITEFRDITEQKRVEEERLRLEEQLHQAQKLESIGQLAGGVAHDFNNMLGVIIGHCEMAMSKVESDSPIYTDLKQIRKAAGRSAEITRQLLAFARKQAVSPQVVDLNRTVEGMMQMLRRLIGEDIELVWRPGENIRPVRLDTSQLDQIMVNLCVNARDAIGGVGRLTVSTASCTLLQGSYVGEIVTKTVECTRVVVQDDGCGMDWQILEHVFEPFFTTKGRGKGTGLGLATVYGAVKQNGGYIEVTSEPGKGTTFSIYFPVTTDEIWDELGEEPSSPVSGRGTILLVEDERAILEMVSRMLEELGYTIMMANSPAEALNISEKYDGEIDLVITDVVMPVMNGRDLVRELLGRRSGLKYIYMSGYTENIISEQDTHEMGVQFIHKPFTQKELAEKVRVLLG